MNSFTPAPSVRDMLVECLDALLAESDQVMDTAEHGRTLHGLDDFFCTQGQTFLQEEFNFYCQFSLNSLITMTLAKTVSLFGQMYSYLETLKNRGNFVYL